MPLLNYLIVLVVLYILNGDLSHMMFQKTGQKQFMAQACELAQAKVRFMSGLRRQRMYGGQRGMITAGHGIRSGTQKRFQLLSAFGNGG